MFKESKIFPEILNSRSIICKQGDNVRDYLCNEIKINVAYFQWYGLISTQLLRRQSQATYTIKVG